MKDEEDAEQVLRWTRKYRNYPPELILHTPGGSSMPASRLPVP